MSFERAFAHTVGIEGGYSNHPSDRGGATKYGITERVARAHGYQGDMREMPLDVAHAIYRAQYWNLLRLDVIDGVCERVAHELFDTAVNIGVGVAGRFLQRALNAFNRQGADYPDLKADGVVGPMTINALKAFIYRRTKDSGEVVLLKALNALQGARYIAIAEADHEQEDFVFGWFKNRVVI